MNYRYNGPVSGLHLADDTGEVVLIDGREYTLPDTDDNVLRLVGQGYLTALPTPAKSGKKGDSDVG